MNTNIERQNYMSANTWIKINSNEKSTKEKTTAS